MTDAQDYEFHEPKHNYLGYKNYFSECVAQTKRSLGHKDTGGDYIQLSVFNLTFYFKALKSLIQSRRSSFRTF